jgi:hypothetical protein
VTVEYLFYNQPMQCQHFMCSEYVLSLVNTWLLILHPNEGFSFFRKNSLLYQLELQLFLVYNVYLPGALRFKTEQYSDTFIHHRRIHLSFVRNRLLDDFNRHPLRTPPPFRRRSPLFSSQWR